MPHLGLGLGVPKTGVLPFIFDPDALDYFSRLDAAGDTDYIPNKKIISNYIVALKDNGLWTPISTHYLFVFVGLPGCVVPVKSGPPNGTNSGFLASDLNSSGLGGSTFTKYISTNRDSNFYAQNDFHQSVYIDTQPTFTAATQAYCGAQNTDMTTDAAFSIVLKSRNASGNTYAFGSFGGLLGTARPTSSITDTYINSTFNAAIVQTSISPLARTLLVFARTGLGGSPVESCSARLKSYTNGAYLNLNTLASVQDAFF